MKFNKFFGSTPGLILVFAIAGLVGFGAIYTMSSASNDKSPVSQKQKDDCRGTCVKLLENKASPDTITVKVGEFVQFNSADGKSHSLSVGKGGEEHSHGGKFSSGEFKADEGWRVQFDKEGSYFFHDHLNPKINILVVVYVEGKEYKVQ